MTVCASVLPDDNQEVLVTNEHTVPPSARRRLPRTRGATSGLLLIILGAWGALIPFIGPYFNFSYTPDSAWTWSAARGWLEVLPGAVTVVGGLLLLLAASRGATLLGAWLGILGGAWFVIGPVLATPWHIGSPGVPAGTGSGLRALERLAMFDLLGVVIVLIAAIAFGRLSVVSMRDVRAARRREEIAVEQTAASRNEPVAPTAPVADTADRPVAENATERHDPWFGRHGAHPAGTRGELPPDARNTAGGPETAAGRGTDAPATPPGPPRA